MCVCVCVCTCVHFESLPHQNTLIILISSSHNRSSPNIFHLLSIHSPSSPTPTLPTHPPLLHPLSSSPTPSLFLHTLPLPLHPPLPAPSHEESTPACSLGHEHRWPSPHYPETVCAEEKGVGQAVGGKGYQLATFHARRQQKRPDITHSLQPWAHIQ